MLDHLVEAEDLGSQGRFIREGARLPVLRHSAQQGFQAHLLPGHSVHNEMARFRSGFVQHVARRSGMQESFQRRGQIVQVLSLHPPIHLGQKRRTLSDRRGYRGTMIPR
jgi:hypothetical protein